jgi:hypothetical protein
MGMGATGNSKMSEVRKCDIVNEPPTSLRVSDCVATGSVLPRNYIDAFRVVTRLFH